MKIVAHGQGSAGAGVAARRWKAGREVTGRARAGDDRGSREGSPAGRWWTLAAVRLGTFMLLLDISAVYVAVPSIQKALGASTPNTQLGRDGQTWPVRAERGGYFEFCRRLAPCWEGAAR